MDASWIRTDALIFCYVKSARGRSNTADLARLADVLRSLDPEVGDGERIDRIRLLEELKSVAAAVQALETMAFAESRRAQQTAAGVPAERVGRGIAAQVGLARRVSPFLPGLGDRRVEAEAKKLAYRLDPQGFLARIRGAEADRHVSVRPAPDIMCRLTGLLPVAQGVAAYAALRRDADSRIGAGDPRSRGQIMADALVERLTGQAHAQDVPVEIALVMTDKTLLAAAGTPGSDEPALLLDHGPIPAPLAHELVQRPSDSTPVWLRRLYTRPGTGELAPMAPGDACSLPTSAGSCAFVTRFAGPRGVKRRSSDHHHAHRSPIRQQSR